MVPKHFPIETALEMVTWKNFRQRIEFCLNKELGLPI